MDYLRLMCFDLFLLYWQFIIVSNNELSDTIINMIDQIKVAYIVHVCWYITHVQPSPKNKGR